ncbi:retrovirus-related Pol polyprotein from transposon 412 [Trichonephila clavipes]|nr:retrovirus-related Pol polyprotein from transposon 412 [Trichonephila clavipes]
MKKNRNRELSLFSRTSEDFGRTRLTKHQIDRESILLLSSILRRILFAKQEEVQKLIKYLKYNDVIESSSSPSASPIVLVRKKDDLTRFRVDYRRLNDVTKKYSYPLPRIDDTLDTLVAKTCFYTLDFKSGYWQVELHLDDKEKTAFIQQYDTEVHHKKASAHGNACALSRKPCLESYKYCLRIE